MHNTLNRCARPVATALAVTLALVAAVPPAFAAEPAAAEPVSLSATAAGHVAALDAAALAAAQEPAPATGESSSFFKSRKGVLASVLFAAGVTFTFVSKSRDRVKSAVR